MSLILLDEEEIISDLYGSATISLNSDIIASGAQSHSGTASLTLNCDVLAGVSAEVQVSATISLDLSVVGNGVQNHSAGAVLTSSLFVTALILPPLIVRGPRFEGLVDKTRTIHMIDKERRKGELTEEIFVGQTS